MADRNDETPRWLAPGAGGDLQRIIAAVAARRGDLAASTESVTRLFRNAAPADVLDRLRELERLHPEAFAAGILAGLAIADAGPASSDAPDANDAGVVSGPVETAQTGPGGLGYLEKPG